MLKLLHTGSVKNIYTSEQESLYLFEFSDRYSVFDWGAMPDELPLKGEALAVMANFFFQQFAQTKFWRGLAFSHQASPTLELEKKLVERFAEKGLPHHSVGLAPELSEEGLALINQTERSRLLAVRPVHVPRGESVRFYQNKPTDCLVPLEVIFRFGLTPGSSFWSRSTDQKYLAELGLSKMIKEGESFPFVIVEFSTKLESADRPLTYLEAQELAGLSETEFLQLIAQTRVQAIALKSLFDKAGVNLIDGKFEFAFEKNLIAGERQFELVDSIGPDELRIDYKGIQLSKESLRQIYRRDPWYEALLAAKKKAPTMPGKSWKSLCELEPPQLLPAQKKCISEMYLILCDELLRSHGYPAVFTDETTKTLAEWEMGAKKFL